MVVGQLVVVWVFLWEEVSSSSSTLPSFPELRVCFFLWMLAASLLSVCQLLAPWYGVGRDHGSCALLGKPSQGLAPADKFPSSGHCLQPSRTVGACLWIPGSWVSAHPPRSVGGRPRACSRISQGQALSMPSQDRRVRASPSLTGLIVPASAAHSGSGDWHPPLKSCRQFLVPPEGSQEASSYGGSTPLLVLSRIMVTCLFGGPKSLVSLPQLPQASLFRAISVQPKLVLSLGLKPEFQHPAPTRRPPTSVSAWGPQGSRPDVLCRFLSVLPFTDWSLGSPLSLWSAPYFQSDLPPVEETHLVQELFLRRALSPLGCRPLPASVFSLFSYLVTWRFFFFFFGSLRSAFSYLSWSLRWASEVVPLEVLFLTFLWEKVSFPSYSIAILILLLFLLFLPHPKFFAIFYNKKKLHYKIA